MMNTLKTLSLKTYTLAALLLALSLLMGLGGGGAQAQVVATIPGYTRTASDNFARADVGPGTEANSTLIGPGWYDFRGNAFHINSNKVADDIVVGTHYPELNALYRAPSEAALNVIVRSTGAGSVARFRAAGGGNGYGWFFYGTSQVFISKSVNGIGSFILSGAPWSGTATGDVFEFKVLSSDSATTTLTISGYHAGSTTAYASQSVTDTTPELQQPGSCGLGVAFAVGAWPDFAAYAANTSGPIITGLLSAVYVAKTSAVLSATPSTGGAGSLSYQWQRALGASGGAFANVAAATTVNLRDTGLTPGAAYRYQVVTTDSGGQPAVTSAPLTVVMLPASAWIIGDCGDSITANSGNTSTATGSTGEVISVLQANGLVVAPYYALNNQAVNGADTSTWLPSGLLPAAVAQWKTDEVDHVLIMLGTNDARDGIARSAADYKANLQNIIAYIQTQMPSTVIVLNGSPYNNLSLSGFSATMLTLLQSYVVQQDSLCNGTTVIQGDRAFYAQSASNATYYIGGDGTHPSSNGQTALGAAWAAPLVRKYAYPATSKLPVRVLQ